MTTFAAVALTTVLIGLGVGLAVALARRRPDPSGTLPRGCAIATPPPETAGGEAEDVVRFEVHVFFTETRETYVVADGRATFSGVPLCLVLGRLDFPVTDTLLPGLADNGAGRCHVELDVTRERATVKLQRPDREVSIPVAAASGLPRAS